jgi:hypothetical protein
MYRECSAFCASIVDASLGSSSHKELDQLVLQDAVQKLQGHKLTSKDVMSIVGNISSILSLVPRDVRVANWVRRHLNAAESAVEVVRLAHYLIIVQLWQGRVVDAAADSVLPGVVYTYTRRAEKK